MAEILRSKPSDSIPTANNRPIGESQVPVMNNVPYQLHQIPYQPIYPLQNQEEQNLGPGIYAVQSNPYMNSLIPLKFHIPTRENGEQQQQGAGAVGGARDAGQRNNNQVVVRRFQFQVQLDLALLIKLAAVVFLFSQDGSTQRLFLLILSALFVYLYQTGTLTPIMRWLRQAARPPARAAQVNNNNNNDANNQRPEGNVGVENPNPNPNPNQEGENQAANPNPNPNGVEGGNRNGVWGIIKEIQMIVVGFVASLLPGFQHHD
ncbi:hypothetical protein LUZ60_008942 [Juncus effusus]|nr:hypothetical protein LUZ60_008942 [Juncus effusus]